MDRGSRFATRDLGPKLCFFCPLIPLAVTGLLISKLRAAYGSNVSRKDIALRDEGCRSISVSALSLRPKLYSLWWLNPTQKCPVIPYNCRKPSADFKVGSTIDRRSTAARALPSLYYAEASAISKGAARKRLFFLLLRPKPVIKHGLKRLAERRQCQVDPAAPAGTVLALHRGSPRFPVFASHLSLELHAIIGASVRPMVFHRCRNFTSCVPLTSVAICRPCQADEKKIIQHAAIFIFLRCSKTIACWFCRNYPACFYCLLTESAVFGQICRMLVRGEG